MSTASAQTYLNLFARETRVDEQEAVEQEGGGKTKNNTVTSILTQSQETKETRELKWTPNRYAQTASMRFHWIACVFSILVSMGVLMVIVGQRHVIEMLNKTEDRLKVESERLSKEHPHEVQLKDLAEKDFSQKLKEVEEMETVVVKLLTGMEPKKEEVQNCQAEMKADTDSLNEAEKAQKENEANLKAESGVWNQEIDSLKAKLLEHSPVCAYVKKGAMIGNLCGSKNQ
ncbi:uncharacterized protein LOC111585217 [Amphiprion ocellaris]|uniref:uncharacterized protein LOC111585217 n=1 Tax=Amphiprion ocellaris TaxID=80972 RepID=UPI00241170FF|nr:uncharacterized protein LOC111585217 [Amphiprion ocellaris]